jgi:cytoskeleton protein RodZ
LPDRFASLVTRRGSEAKTQPQRRAGNAGEDGVAAGGATTRQVAGGAAGEDVTAGAGQEAGGKPEAADRAGENEADTVVADNASTRERALVAAAPAELSADRANSESRGATPTSESSSAARSASNALAAEPSLRDGDDSAKPGTVHAALAGNDSAAANGEGTTQASGRSRIVLKASSLTWVQIKDRDRGRVLMSGLLRQGETYGVPDQRGLRLTVGNAGGLDILVDGLAVQAIGKAGEVRRGLVLDADALGSGNFVFE